ncbi:MAG: YwqG family protein [Ruminococcus sp.]|nr:YwqG family protein [Ruminococcus sp.]
MLEFLKRRLGKEKTAERNKPAPISEPENETELIDKSEPEPTAQAPRPAPIDIPPSERTCEDWCELYDSVTEKQVNEALDEMKKITKAPVIFIKYSKANNLPPQSSKFGGTPYIPKDGQAPCDKDGRQLQLLAQFNLSELPENDFMPKQGMLQFWIINNAMLGMECDASTGNTAQVLYFESIDNDVTTEQVDAKYSPWRDENHTDYFPLSDEFSLSFSKGEESMGSEDFRWVDAFCEVWNRLHPNFGLSEYPFEDIVDMTDLRNYSACKLGGYASFAQSDPSGKDCQAAAVLFEMNSTMSREIMWGDLGAANFFISDEDLKTRNFSNVQYHWDCS